jgi:hypothetical protein
MQQAIHVLIDHAHLGRMDEVARQLAARGFTLHATFDAIGVLAGTAEVVDLDGLAGVPGVLSIENVRHNYGPSLPGTPP